MKELPVFVLREMNRKSAIDETINNLAGVLKTPLSSLLALGHFLCALLSFIFRGPYLKIQ